MRLRCASCLPLLLLVAAPVAAQPSGLEFTLEPARQTIAHGAAPDCTIRVEHRGDAKRALALPADRLPVQARWRVEPLVAPPPRVYRGVSRLCGNDAPLRDADFVWVAPGERVAYPLQSPTTAGDGRWYAWDQPGRYRMRFELVFDEAAARDGPFALTDAEPHHVAAWERVPREAFTSNWIEVEVLPAQPRPADPAQPWGQRIPTWPESELPALRAEQARALGRGLRPRSAYDEWDEGALDDGRTCVAAAESPDRRWVAVHLGWEDVDDERAVVEIWRRGATPDPLRGATWLARGEVQGFEEVPELSPGLAWVDATRLVGGAGDAGVLWRWAHGRLVQTDVLLHAGGDVTGVIVVGDLIVLDCGRWASVWRLERDSQRARPLVVFRHDWEPLQAHPDGQHVLGWQDGRGWQAWRLPR